MNRRQILKGIASTALVAGFDPVSHRWVRAAEASACASCLPLAEVPPLDGALYTDLPTRAADSTDQGNIVRQLPCAVLRPGSVEDIQKMIRFCRKHGIRAATRGQHHSTHGQGLTCGLIIENRPLNRIHSIGPTSADVDSGVTWKELLLAAFEQGLKPRGVTGYAGLSLGGTLSMGGCPLTNRQGALVDHVRELTVVTGRGDIVRCSEDSHAELFEAVLAGLGQCGVIARVTVDLVPAKPLARTYLLHYADTATFFRDFRTLINRGELDEVYNVCIPPGSSVFTYQLNATIFFDPSEPPDDAHLLRDLTLPPAAAVTRDQSYPDYALAVDAQIEVLRAAVMWDSLVKPWFDVWLPDTAVEQYVGDVLANLTPRDVGTGGFILTFAQRRSQMTRPFFRIPRDEGEGWVWLFDITTTSMQPGFDPVFVAEMLERNRRLFERARDLGGTRYPIGAQAFTRDDWVRQYGEAWPEFARRKKKYDPDNILTPGPGIF
jgi:FAD/FMN-containing dehydrogenase